MILALWPDFTMIVAHAVRRSPRLGTESETYGQIIINSNDDANGILQLSPRVLRVPEDVGNPQVNVIRDAGTFGQVSVLEIEHLAS